MPRPSSDPTHFMEQNVDFNWEDSLSALPEHFAGLSNHVEEPDTMTTFTTTDVSAGEGHNVKNNASLLPSTPPPSTPTTPDELPSAPQQFAPPLTPLLPVGPRQRDGRKAPAPRKSPKKAPAPRGFDEQRRAHEALLDKDIAETKAAVSQFQLRLFRTIVLAVLLIVGQVGFLLRPFNPASDTLAAIRSTDVRQGDASCAQYKMKIEAASDVTLFDEKQDVLYTDPAPTGHMTSAIFDGNVPPSQAFLLRHTHSSIIPAVVRPCAVADGSCPISFPVCMDATAADFSPIATVWPPE
eukprot:6441427-Prymnesium_polylepis.1